MAVYNEIGIGRWNRFIQKLTSIKGGPPARQLSSEIGFQHPIFHGVENRYLEGWDRFAVATNAGPVAGQNGIVQIRNPAGSNIIAVIEKLQMASTIADTAGTKLLIGATNTDLTNIDINRTLDTRGRSAATCITSHQNNNLGTLGTFAFVGLLANLAPIDFILDEMLCITLNPGQAIQVAGSAVNTSFLVNWIWRERFLEDSERT